LIAVVPQEIVRPTGYLTDYLVGNSRSPRGSGSTYTREDGRVVGEYEADGKERYIYGRTKKDVASKLAKAMLVIQNSGALHYVPPLLPPGFTAA